MAKTNDVDLIRRTQSALEDFGETPWLPDLSDDLVKMGWSTLYEKAGLSPSTYGTSRFIAKDALSHINVVGYLFTSLTVELLDDSLAAYYQNAGVEFYSASEIKDTGLLTSVEDALSIIRQVPTLAGTIDGLVRSIHLIKPEDDDYDVSFSEPHIPFSIFVSVPRHQNPTTALRIAEAVVHEAMHLQLTLIESLVALVNSAHESYFSPWRGEYRNAHGVIHALYVFRVVARFLEGLLSNRQYVSEYVEHIQGRRYEIGRQICEIASFLDCPELTVVGTRFVQQLVAPFDLVTSSV